MLKIAMLMLLADGPAQAPAPKSTRQCYAAHCEYSAKPGQPIRGQAECIAGYVQEHATMDLGNGTTVDLCMCCPAVDTTKPDAPAKKEK